MLRVLLSGLIAGAVALAGGINISQASSSRPDQRVFSLGPISDTTSHQIAKLDEVASKLAGRHAIVNCWSEHDWAQLQTWLSVHHYRRDVGAPGFTNFETHRIQLSPFVCEILHQILTRSANQPLFAAFGVTLLAHESGHVAGILAENKTECRAIRIEPEAARLLGLSRALGKRLQHIYRGTIYPTGPPRYSKPPCLAGLPGLLVPDTLGNAADLQPLQRTATAVANSLSGWKNLGGADAVQPLGACAVIVSRTFERARLNETLSGPKHESFSFSDARLATHRAFATALRRYRHLEHCEIGTDNRWYRKSHWRGTFSPGRIPSAFVRLSPHVQAFRLIFTRGSRKWNLDRIHIFDSAQLGYTALDFSVPAGTSTGQELRATRAALRAIRSSG